MIETEHSWGSNWAKLCAAFPKVAGLPEKARQAFHDRFTKLDQPTLAVAIDNLRESSDSDRTSVERLARAYGRLIPKHQAEEHHVRGKVPIRYEVWPREFGRVQGFSLNHEREARAYHRQRPLSRLLRVWTDGEREDIDPGPEMSDERKAELVVAVREAFSPPRTPPHGVSSLATTRSSSEALDADGLYPPRGVFVNTPDSENAIAVERRQGATDAYAVALAASPSVSDYDLTELIVAATRVANAVETDPARRAVNAAVIAKYLRTQMELEEADGTR